MEVKGVVFDLDDTLVYMDPKYRHDKVGSALSELGVKGIDNNTIDEFWYDLHRNKFISEVFGVPYNDFWEKFAEKENVEVRRRFTKFYKDARILKYLKKIGIKTGILTSAPINIRDMEIELLDYVFDGVITANYKNGIKEKPNPEGLLLCLDSMKIGIQSAIMVGNGLEDILTGKAAGVIDVLIDRGNYKSDVVPTYRIDSLMKLRKLFFDNKSV